MNKNGYKILMCGWIAVLHPGSCHKSRWIRTIPNEKWKCERFFCWWTDYGAPKVKKKFEYWERTCGVIGQRRKSYRTYRVGDLVCGPRNIMFLRYFVFVLLFFACVYGLCVCVCVFVFFSNWLELGGTLAFEEREKSFHA